RTIAREERGKRLSAGTAPRHVGNAERKHFLSAQQAYRLGLDQPQRARPGLGSHQQRSQHLFDQHLLRGRRLLWTDAARGTDSRLEPEYAIPVLDGGREARQVERNSRLDAIRSAQRAVDG